jgi:hypothetical protein
MDPVALVADPTTMTEIHMERPPVVLPCEKAPEGEMIKKREEGGDGTKNHKGERSGHHESHHAVGFLSSLA